MDNPMETVLYSAKAVERLLMVEQKHDSWFYSNQAKGYKGDCKGCYFDPNLYGDYAYPCHILLTERVKHVIETRAAVALLLGERSE